MTPAQLDELEAFMSLRSTRSSVDDELAASIDETGTWQVLRASVLRELLALGRAQEAGLNRLAEAADVTADPEAAHSIADEALLAAVSPEVREAYRAVQEACSWWATA